MKFASIRGKSITKVLEKFILSLHNAFIRGRQILNSVLVANKYIDSRIRPGIHGFL